MRVRTPRRLVLIDAAGKIAGGLRFDDLARAHDGRFRPALRALAEHEASSAAA